jgi:2-haloacid dehalogenase
MKKRYDAVLFDLLTALLDSWTLWNSVAGSDEAGRLWRTEYLKITYGAGRYRPYEELVGKAAVNVGLPRRLSDELASRYREIKPWPEVNDVLGELRDAGVSLGVVTNCSEPLGRTAIDRIAVQFRVVVTAERAGYYKPDPRPYRTALEELGTTANRSLFVAGSCYDLFGTAWVGLPAWWHNRIGMTLPENAPVPIAQHDNLRPILPHVLADS